MTQDQQTFRRAANAAVLGLVVQLLLAVFVALLGLAAESSPVHAMSWYLFGGLPLWAILFLVYNQHRLERAEALEAEQLAATDSDAARLFDEAGQQLALAKRRLDNLYKYGLSIVTLVAAGYLATVGIILGLLHHRGIVDGSVTADLLLGDRVGPMVLVFLFAAVAFVGFLVARYLSGMTQVEAWKLLRGGAGYLMGNVLVAAAFAIASVLAFLGNMQAYMVLGYAVPIFMVLLAVEMSIGFVLSLYRPRRPGEMPRPAFDSRILGWLTQPQSIGRIVSETLNYQFGFEISRSWFYQLLGKALTPLCIIGVIILIAASSIVIVGPQQQAVITRFGQLQRVAQPGLSLKLPWPIDHAQRYDTTRIHELTVGSAEGQIKSGTAILWTNEHTIQDEVYLVTAPARDGPVEGDVAGNTVAGELIGGQVNVKYRINDLERYVRSAIKPDEALKMLVEQQVNAYFVTNDVDTLLGADRERAGELLRQRIQRAADASPFDLGLDVLFVGVIAVHPPQKEEVAAKFHEQIGALQEKQSTIEQARKEAVTTLASVAGSRTRAIEIGEAMGRLDELKNQLGQTPEAEKQTKRQAIAQQEAAIEAMVDLAGGQAAQVLAEARAYRWQQALTELSRAERFVAELAAYRKAPQYYKARKYLDTLAGALADRRKIILTMQADKPPTLRFNLEDAATDIQSMMDLQ